MKFIKAAGIITENSVLKDHILGFEDSFKVMSAVEETDLKGMQIIDAGDLFVAPGLIDMHIHGSGGKDAMDGKLETLETISRTIVKNGVTGFLPTTMTMDIERIGLAIKRIGKCMNKEMPGAQVLGAHMEGPFISDKFKGAQDANYILKSDWKYINPYKKVIKMVTISPEEPGAKELIERLREHGIIASIGHTAATYEQAIEGIEAGASHCTHLFNAMTGIHHRNPGTVTAALSSDIYCELIADKIHVHPGMFEMLRKVKGADRITLITDSMEAGGMPDGEYFLGGQQVVVRGGEARLHDGTLAGSVLKLNQALFNFFTNTKAELYEVFRMASLNPARELGIDKTKGSIELGKDADFSLIDKDFNVHAVYIKGKCVYSV